MGIQEVPPTKSIFRAKVSREEDLLSDQAFPAEQDIRLELNHGADRTNRVNERREGSVLAPQVQDPHRVPLFIGTGQGFLLGEKQVRKRVESEVLLPSAQGQKRTSSQPGRAFALSEAPFEHLGRGPAALGIADEVVPSGETLLHFQVLSRVVSSKQSPIATARSVLAHKRTLEQTHHRVY